jgi:hypothetical protein
MRDPHQEGDARIKSAEMANNQQSGDRAAPWYCRTNIKTLPKEMPLLIDPFPKVCRPEFFVDYALPAFFTSLILPDRWLMSANTLRSALKFRSAFCGRFRRAPVLKGNPDVLGTAVP